MYIQVAEDEADEPDNALRLQEGLRESSGGEIQTVTASAADADIYRSATTFEDIIENKQLLQARTHTRTHTLTYTYSFEYV